MFRGPNQIHPYKASRVQARGFSFSGSQNRCASKESGPGGSRISTCNPRCLLPRATTSLLLRLLAHPLKRRTEVQLRSSLGRAT